MTWKVKKSGNGYYVVTTTTCKKHSKKPLSLERAKKQLVCIAYKCKPQES